MKQKYTGLYQVFPDTDKNKEKKTKKHSLLVTSTKKRSSFKQSNKGFYDAFMGR